MERMLNKWAGEGFDANVAICEASVCLIKTSPQYMAHFRPIGPIYYLWDTFFYHIEVLEDTKYSITIGVRLLDELNRALKFFAETVDSAYSVLSSEQRGYPYTDVGDLSVAIK
jgi:hypothetical protein